MVNNTIWSTSTSNNDYTLTSGSTGGPWPYQYPYIQPVPNTITGGTITITDTDTYLRTKPTVTLEETDKMNLIKLLGEMQDKETLRKKVQEMVNSILEQKRLELTGEHLLLMLYALMFTLKHAEEVVTSKNK